MFVLACLYNALEIAFRHCVETSFSSSAVYHLVIISPLLVPRPFVSSLASSII